MNLYLLCIIITKTTVVITSIHQHDLIFSRTSWKKFSATSFLFLLKRRIAHFLFLCFVFFFEQSVAFPLFLSEWLCVGRMWEPLSACSVLYFRVICFLPFGSGAISTKEHDGPGLLLSPDVNSVSRRTLSNGRRHLEKALGSLSFHFLVPCLQYLPFPDQLWRNLLVLKTQCFVER